MPYQGQRILILGINVVSKWHVLFFLFEIVKDWTLIKIKSSVLPTDHMIIDNSTTQSFVPRLWIMKDFKDEEGLFLVSGIANDPKAAIFHSSDIWHFPSNH